MFRSASFSPILTCLLVTGAYRRLGRSVLRRARRDQVECRERRRGPLLPGSNRHSSIRRQWRRVSLRDRPQPWSCGLALPGGRSGRCVARRSRWSRRGRHDFRPLASPLIVRGALVIATFRTDAPSGELLVLDPATGAVRWRLRLDEASVSTPAVADGELYLGTEASNVLAIHEVNPVVPRLAVFYDSTLAGAPATPGGRLAMEYFRELGYQVLGADTLAGFLAARIGDQAPSAIVFAMDLIPESLSLQRRPTTSSADISRPRARSSRFSVPQRHRSLRLTRAVLGEEPARGGSGHWGFPAQVVE